MSNNSCYHLCTYGIPHGSVRVLRLPPLAGALPRKSQRPVGVPRAGGDAPDQGRSVAGQSPGHRRG
eukprot:3201205-Heterocapsa_arctica.AAC.1